ncbi:MAG: helix-turn-helix domain-containing protein [Cellulosilyticaceae bacterium]
MNMSKEIVIMLKRRDKKQEDLCALFGCTQPTISKRLSNNTWKVNDLERIADYLDFDMDVLFIDRQKKER